MAKYIDALDGLRAVAVLLVLLFHAGFDFAQGGFVGVDVFFVVSGFLITGIIIRDVEAGEWSFGRFYLRRAARLLPALFVTLLATFAAAYFILAPDDLMRLGRSGIYAAVSGSNFFFWLEAGYFDQDAASKPLLHTWSLGVEEQFYLIWPAVVLALAKWRGRKTVFRGLAILGAVSLIVSIALTNNHPDTVFFLMPFRIYQFALGGLIALGVTLKPGNVRNAAGFASIAALLVIAYVARGESSSYLLNAVAPALAAAGFIWCAEAAPIKRVFASAPMRWIGQRSYSIYLVHWPIMVLWPMATDFDLSPAEGVIALAVSIALGAALHGFVETPLRFKSTTTPVRRMRVLAGVMMLLAACLFTGAHFWGLRGYPSRIPEEIRASVGDLDAAKRERSRVQRMKICQFNVDTPISEYKQRICAAPPPDRRSYMVIGDSHAGDAYLILKEAYPEVYFGQMTLPGCVLEVPWVPRESDAADRAWCQKFFALAFDLTLKKGFDGVVLAASWRDYQRKDIEQIIAWANKSDIDAVFMTDRPRFKERVPTILLTSFSREQAQKRSEKLEVSSYEVIAKRMEARLADRTKIINMYDLMCDAACPIFDEKGRLIYIDSNHISLPGSSWVARRLRAAYPEFLSAK